MMKYRIFIVFFFTASAICNNSRGQSCYWIGFTDKSNSGFSITRPSEFLSHRSVERRMRQHISLNESDLPVTKAYKDSIVKTGASFIHSSKWLNGITVTLSSDTLAKKISKFSFVREIQLTKPASAGKRAFQKFEIVFPYSGIDSTYYGQSVYQVGQLNGQFLHTNGYKGKGIGIAVLDAGFYHANQLPAFDSLLQAGCILGTRNFVNPESDIYEEHSHGMMVLSIMGSNLPGQLIGTAPEASYWLLRSEDAASEYLIEEDNWVAAAEFADSVGADIINSSLGYYTFDLAEMNHTYYDMDGKTTHVAKAANQAVAKGMLVFASAGNEGNKTWHYIITPADGDSVIAVAAVDKNGIKASFSSVGPAPDGNVKPDLAAMGVNTIVENTNGKIATGSGTSFSSPVLAGMAACLWQAHPSATAFQIRQALIKSGSQFQHPDSLLGYGIPDMAVASALLGNINSAREISAGNWIVFPNPFQSSFTIFPPGTSDDNTEMEIITISGNVIAGKRISGAGPYRMEDLDGLPAGIYFLRLSGKSGTEVHKIIKSSRE